MECGKSSDISACFLQCLIVVPNVKVINIAVQEDRFTEHNNISELLWSRNLLLSLYDPDFLKKPYSKLKSHPLPVLAEECKRPLSLSSPRDSIAWPMTAGKSVAEGRPEPSCLSLLWLVCWHEWKETQGTKTVHKIKQIYKCHPKGNKSEVRKSDSKALTCSCSAQWILRAPELQLQGAALIDMWHTGKSHRGH